MFSYQFLFLIHGYVFVNVDSLTILLLVYITIEAAFHLQKWKLLLYSILNVGLSIWIAYVKSDQALKMMVISLFLYFLVVTINQMICDRQQQKEIYDQLLGEYRTLRYYL